MKLVRLIQKLCMALMVFMLALAGAVPLEASEMREELHELARDTVMGKLLDFDNLFTEGVDKLRALADSRPTWGETASGLEYLVLGDEGNSFVAVRIDPEKFAFTLCMASEKGQSLTVADWALSGGLLVAVNASMYLPDEQTSTGYMQSATHSNNARIGSRLGAFFVAEPLLTEPQTSQQETAVQARNASQSVSQNPLSIPRVAIIEKSDPDWEKRIGQYGIRVQNFRLLGRDGSIPWGDKKERGSIAAIGQEKDGHILFLVSVHPMTVPEFVIMAKTVAPTLENAMYVEGSVKVGMYLDVGGEGQSWLGRKNVVYTPAPKETTIPNVIGVVPRQ